MSTTQQDQLNKTLHSLDSLYEHLNPSFLGMYSGKNKHGILHDFCFPFPDITRIRYITPFQTQIMFLLILVFCLYYYNYYIDHNFEQRKKRRCKKSGKKKTRTKK